MPLSIKAYWTLRTPRPRGRRALSACLVSFSTLGAIIASCASVILFGRPAEALAICAVAAMKLAIAGNLARRARRTLARLDLTAQAATPISRAGRRLSRTLALTVLGLAAVAFAAGAVDGRASVRTGALVLIVAAIPVEPRATVSAIVAASAARIARRKAVVRHLAAIDAIAATTVICTTRDGSLTQNELTVTRVIAGGRGYETTGAGYSPTGDIRAEGVKVSLGDNVALDECLLAGFACNDSQVGNDDGAWRVIGDPLEAALLTSAVKHGVAKAPPRVATLPFAPDRRFMATLHRLDDDEPGIVYVKGSVERVLYLCDTHLDADGRRRELAADVIRAAAHALTRRGLRVVAFAAAQVPPAANTLTEHSVPRLTFLGLQAMHDPVRPHVLDAIRACQDAGILVKMLTGDDATAASMTAAWVGLDGDALMTGTKLRTCPSDTLPDAVGRTSVFARMSPEEKEILVRALQSRRHVVTMTGENVDDLLALRRADTAIDVRSNDAAGADIGFEDTRPIWNTADLVLTGGDFASITEIVGDGRRMLNNLAKYFELVLPSALGPGLVLAAAALTGTAVPIQPLQLLWVSVVAVLMLQVAPLIGAATPAGDLMRHPPPARALLGRPCSVRALLVTGMLVGWAFGLYHWALAHDATVVEARTAVVDVVVFILLAHLLCSRLPRRPRFRFARREMRGLGLAAGAVFLIMLQLAYTQVPVLNDLFGSAPLAAASWLRVMAAAGSCFVLVMASNLLPVRADPTAKDARITRTE